MSQRDGLRNAVIIAAVAVVVILVGLMAALALTINHAAHQAAHSLSTIVPPGSPAAAAGPLIPHPPRTVIIGAAVLLVLGLLLRLRKR